MMRGTSFVYLPSLQLLEAPTMHMMSGSSLAKHAYGMEIHVHLSGRNEDWCVLWSIVSWYALMMVYIFIYLFD